MKGSIPCNDASYTCIILFIIVRVDSFENHEQKRPKREIPNFFRKKFLKVHINIYT